MTARVTRRFREQDLFVLIVALGALAWGSVTAENPGQVARQVVVALVTAWLLLGLGRIRGWLRHRKLRP